MSEATAGAPRLDVIEVGLACCALEAAADDGLRAARREGGPGPAGVGASPRTVLVVAGTVTDAMCSAIRARYDAVAGPVSVVAFGACAMTGGPYWDSYAVTPGIETVLPVDVVVPGCPPRPEALREALDDLERRGDA